MPNILLLYTVHQSQHVPTCVASHSYQKLIIYRPKLESCEAYWMLNDSRHHTMLMHLTYPYNVCSAIVTNVMPVYPTYTIHHIRSWLKIAYSIYS